MPAQAAFVAIAGNARREAWPFPGRQTPYWRFGHRPQGVAIVLPYLGQYPRVCFPSSCVNATLDPAVKPGPGKLWTHPWRTESATCPEIGSSPVPCPAPDIREMGQVRKEAKSRPGGLPVVHSAAAGIDTGSRLHVTAASPNRCDELVQAFRVFTSALERMTH